MKEREREEGGGGGEIRTKIKPTKRYEPMKFLSNANTCMEIKMQRLMHVCHIYRLPNENTLTHTHNILLIRRRKYNIYFRVWVIHIFLIIM